MRDFGIIPPPPPRHPAVERLRRAAWWDWPAEHARTLMAGTPADIARVATEHGLGRLL
ncbi:hypothetical protein [Streptomyces sp. NPDC017868]|uniref:hypothetical protein n=1 Tax=Streptomyces sp. NPDC017868 TaxID=3365014 RepID=UPI00378935AC